MTDILYRVGDKEYESLDKSTCLWYSYPLRAWVIKHEDQQPDRSVYLRALCYYYDVKITEDPMSKRSPEYYEQLELDLK